MAQTKLELLLQQSEAYYPHLSGKRAERDAVLKDVAFERKGFVPEVVASYQANYATANNITGMFLPQYLMPISGPPSATNNYDPVYGSAAGLLLNWEPFTFGKRSSRVNLAQSNAQLAEYDTENALLEHQVRFIETYLDLWQARSLQSALMSNVERYNFNLEMSQSLVIAGLQPGVDSAQIKAELAEAQIYHLQTVSKAEAYHIKLMQYLEEEAIVINFGDFPEAKSSIIPAQSQQVHPLLKLSAQRREFAELERSVINRSLLPDLQFWGIGYARGSAINFDGTVNDATEGLSFSRYNYGVGFQLSFSLFQFASTREKIKKQQHVIAAMEYYDQEVRLAMDSRRKTALVTLNNAIKAAELSNSFVEAADFAYTALQSRYDAGLVNLTALLQSQYKLAQAEADYIENQAELWKALLYVAAVEGDIDIFLTQLR